MSLKRAEVVRDIQDVEGGVRDGKGELEGRVTVKKEVYIYIYIS